MSTGKKTQPDVLTARQLRAVALLSQGKMATTVASEIGVSEVTISRWKKLASFREALAEGARTATDEALSLATANLRHAVQFVVDDLHHKDIRRRQLAAKNLVKIWAQLRQSISLEFVDDLERFVEKQIEGNGQ